MPTIVDQDRSVLKRATCRHCGGVNEYAPNEVKILWRCIDYGGTMSVTKGFKCAQCGGEVITHAS